MPRVATVREADLTRALKALARAGLTVASIMVRADGVEIVPGPPAAPGRGGLTPPAPAAQPATLDDWRNRRGARAAQGS